METVRVEELSLQRRAHLRLGRARQLSLWRRANVLSYARRTLAGGCPCQSALAVAPRECVSSLANPLLLQRSCASKRSCCGAARMCVESGEPSSSVDILRIEVLSLWRGANVSQAWRTPSEIVRVEALSLRRGAPCVSQRPSRGSLACFHDRAWSRAPPAWPAADRILIPLKVAREALPQVQLQHHNF